MLDKSQLTPEEKRRRAAEKTILIVEDNELNMKLFHDLIQAHGYNILQTKDGMEALKLARQHKPDLILMDIQLPEVSGLEVTKWIKEDDNLKSIPIIAVTAFAMKGDEEKIREGGCEAYIAKPISVVQFLEIVDRFLGTDPSPRIARPLCAWLDRDHEHERVDSAAYAPAAWANQSSPLMTYSVEKLTKQNQRETKGLPPRRVGKI